MHGGVRESGSLAASGDLLEIGRFAVRVSGGAHRREHPPYHAAGLTPPYHSPVATRLGELLDGERRRTFVGRRRELAEFDEAVAGRSPRRVLFVHGEGGIGKTSLLLELRARAQAAGRTVALVDGRDIDASPAG